jgi:hypothetical protein
VAIKQYNLNKLKKAFKKDLMILKQIKKLKFENNANFPMILSAKVSRSTGEILMTYAGVDLYGHLEVNQCISMNLKLKS